MANSRILRPFSILMSVSTLATNLFCFDIERKIIYIIRIAILLTLDSKKRLIELNRAMNIIGMTL